ncbi:MAG: HEAT repeat domain-containing protein [Kibdelosporangium sp.]
MDEVARLIESFRSVAATDDVDGSAKVEIVVKLEGRVGDERVLELFNAVIADPDEYDLARIECLKILRLWPPDEAGHRRVVGRTIATVLAAGDDDDLLVRQYAAGALGPYTRDATVFDTLAGALVDDEDIDVRYNALSSVEEAGADERAVALLTRLADDPRFRSAALRTLRTWTS